MWRVRRRGTVSVGVSVGAGLANGGVRRAGEAALPHFTERVTTPSRPRAQSVAMHMPVPRGVPPPAPDEHFGRDREFEEWIVHWRRGGGGEGYRGDLPRPGPGGAYRTSVCPCTAGPEASGTSSPKWGLGVWAFIGALRPCGGGPVRV